MLLLEIRSLGRIWVDGLDAGLAEVDRLVFVDRSEEFSECSGDVSLRILDESQRVNRIFSLVRCWPVVSISILFFSGPFKKSAFRLGGGFRLPSPSFANFGDGAVVGGHRPGGILDA